MATAQAVAPVKYDPLDIFNSAVSVLEVLPEESQRKVLNFSVELLKEDEDNPFRPKSERELLERIDLSLQHLDEGNYRRSEEVEKDIIEEFGLHVSNTDAAAESSVK